MPIPANEAIQITVHADASHRPAGIIRCGQRVAVEQVLDTWIISAARRGPEAEVDRQYFSIQLMDGVRFKIYHDRIVDAWFEHAS